jgi:Fur family iron response transcriptional regulator
MSEMNTYSIESKRDIALLLRSKGITPTAQRVKIASAMLARPQHLSAEQVLELANQDGKRVSKATVYNTLGLFSRKGLIRELVVDSTRSFYDSSTHTHYHLYNPDTQELMDMESDLVKVETPTELPEGAEIDKIEVVVHLKQKNS